MPMRLDIYFFAHVLKERVPFVWDAAEKFNEWLFVLRYGKRLNNLKEETKEGDYLYRRLKREDGEALAHFFEVQPEEAFDYFKPHAFDLKTIDKLLRNRSFLAYGVFDGERLVGYYFLRSYFMGKSYLGKIVDNDYRGKGIGKHMCLYAMDIAKAMGMHMYETISKENISSLYSTQRVLKVNVVKKLDDNYLYIEDLERLDKSLETRWGGYKLVSGLRFQVQSWCRVERLEVKELGRRRGYSYAA